VGAFLSAPLLHVRYDAEVAAEAWGKIFAFFDRHLGAAAVSAAGA
jgi:hypothetical protein